jgi:hypothetical protein
LAVKSFNILEIAASAASGLDENFSLGRLKNDFVAFIY